MSCTSTQLDALLDYLDQHRDLARGLLRTSDGRIRARRLWQELAQLLNSLGGSVKTVQQWQKVWTDRKHLAKKNAAADRRSTTATGGGQGDEPLASWELRVLSIMGEGFGAPATTARVPIVPFINFEDEVASYGWSPAEGMAVPLSASQPLVLSPASQLVEQVVVNLSPPSTSCVERPEDSSNQRSASRNATRSQLPARRRRRVAGNNNISALLQSEEEKLTIMRGIRDAVLELTAAVKELVELKRRDC